MDVLPDTRFTFDDFELDCSKRELRYRGEAVQLKSKTFDLLQYLVQNHGMVVSKSDLLDHVWPGQFVEENNLSVQVAAIRKAFAAAGGAEFIKTVSGRGYMFIAEVRDFSEELIVEHRSFSRVVIEESVNDHASETKHIGSFQALKYVSIGAGVAVMLLSVLGFVYWRTTTVPSPPELKFSSVTSSGDVTSATVSPDGGYAVFARRAGTGESLWLRQIEGGGEQLLVEAQPLRYTGLKISPDGNSIFATTFSPQLPDPQLMKIPLLGGVPQIIPHITTGAGVSISPDGTKLVYNESRSSMNQTQVLTSNIDGSGKKVLARGPDGERSFPNFDANPVAWSPDGRWIATVFEEKGEKIKQGILLITPDGNVEKILGDQRWDQVNDVTWNNDQEIVFTAYTFDQFIGQIWSISAITGRTTRITNDLSSYSWIANSRKGLVAVMRKSVSHLSLAALKDGSDPLTARIYSESGHIDNVEFLSDDAIVFSSSKAGKRDLWRMGVDGGGVQQLTVGADVAFGITVSRKSKRIVFSGMDDGRFVLKATSLEGRDLRVITDGPEDVFPWFSSEGDLLVFQNGLNSKKLTAWRIDLDGFRESPISEQSTNRPSPSPDGAMIAFYFQDEADGGVWKLGFMSSVDGSFRSKLGFPRPVNERQFRWLPGGSAILQPIYEDGRIEFMLMPTSGEPATTIKTGIIGDLQSFALSPNGKSIAVSSAEHRDDIVLLTPR